MGWSARRNALARAPQGEPSSKLVNARTPAPMGSLARCVLVLQHNGDVRAEGDLRVLNLAINAAIQAAAKARSEKGAGLVRPATIGDLAAVQSGRRA